MPKPARASAATTDRGRSRKTIAERGRAIADSVRAKRATADLPPPQAATQLDGFYVTRQVEELTCFSCRWIYHLVRIKKFPAPDVPGRVGSAHRWRRSTIKRALDEMAAAAQLKAGA
jgi:predicted DNA-binding transcriptional regulator AlpA